MGKKIVLASFLVLLAFTACRRPAQQQEASARIGTTLITQADVDARLRFLDEKDRQFAQTPLGKENLLQIITREKLILADARANGLDTQKEYLQAVDAKRAELDRIYDEFAEQTLLNLWYNRHEQDAGLQASEQEIKNYFDKYPYEMTVKQIIVDNAQTADQVLRRLKQAPSDWNAMSAQYNVAPEALKTLTFMPGEYLPALEVIAANSPTGKAEGFFKTPQGFHIIMKTGERRLAFKDAQPRIRQVLEQQKLDNLLNTLKTKYEVIIYDQHQ